MRDNKMIYGSSNINFERLINHIKICDNNIIYSEQSFSDIKELFHIRKKLHEEIYCHKGVVASQYIIVELLIYINQLINIVENITDLDFFCRLTDNYILEFTNFNHGRFYLSAYINIQYYTNLLETHNLLPFIGKKISVDKINFEKKLENYCKTNRRMNELKDNIVFYQNKIGYISGNKENPLDNILVYKSKDSNKENIIPIKIDKEDVSLILPSNYQENIIILFYKFKNPEDIKYISDNINKLLE